MKAISIKADGTIATVDVDVDNHAEFQSFINDDFPNIVRRGLHVIGNGVVMVVADTGGPRNLPLNDLASYLYGEQVHGQPIRGDVLLIGERMTLDGADFDDIPSAEAVEAGLQRMSDLLL